VIEGRLTQDRFDHAGRFHAGQPLVDALVLEGEVFVVDAEAVQQRRLKVAAVHRIAHNVVGKLVRLAVNDAPLHADASEPKGEAARMVIAISAAGSATGSFRKRSPQLCHH